jgi:4-amino-4-deoxy-L-arabinose transferase-like glycosyltransferase
VAPGRRLLIQCVALAAVAALVRLPFTGSIGPDEGGYAYVAWRWAHGGELYRSTWIDRPQGLVLVYRALIAIAGSAWAIRLGAIAAAIAVTLLLVAIGRLLVSGSAGPLAGALYAVVGLGPRIEGYTFNGELAAAVPSTAAVAAGLVGWRRDSRWWLALAGALGGCAILMKQSGFDGLAVVLVLATLGASGCERRRRLAAAAGSAAVPIAASALAGWLGGWHVYWSAVVSSHFDTSSAASRLSRLGGSLPAATRDLLPLTLLAALGAWRLRDRPTPVRVGLVWVAAAIVGVNVGGLYWPHYYVQVLPPLSLLAAAGLAGLPLRRAWAAAAVITAPALFFVGNVVFSPDARSDRLVKYAAGFENDQRVAAYVRAHSSSGDAVYAFHSRADFYFLARRRAASPYIWTHPLKEIPGARAALARTLAARRPRFVVMFQHPKPYRFRDIRRILRRDYRVVWRAPLTGTEVLAPVPRAGPG